MLFVYNRKRVAIAKHLFSSVKTDMSCKSLRKVKQNLYLGIIVRTYSAVCFNERLRKVDNEAKFKFKIQTALRQSNGKHC